MLLKVLVHQDPVEGSTESDVTIGSKKTHEDYQGGLESAANPMTIVPSSHPLQFLILVLSHYMDTTLLPRFYVSSLFAPPECDAGNYILVWTTMKSMQLHHVPKPSVLRPKLCRKAIPFILNDIDPPDMSSFHRFQKSLKVEGAEDRAHEFLEWRNCTQTCTEGEQPTSRENFKLASMCILRSLSIAVLDMPSKPAMLYGGGDSTAFYRVIRAGYPEDTKELSLALVGMWRNLGGVNKATTCTRREEGHSLLLENSGKITRLLKSRSRNTRRVQDSPFL
ncbi:hypothetical protein C8J55DRAFT_548853 [Lentinula edodes]|uniref:Uncharacterized protein n=1 Tax=Lentinula lateritia TaxID=40482 RepID=A0A9W9AHA8_9AGAR|nr:hypothetical protein C8J55DRAFT_548853 [Lentinula edodes]